MSQYIDERLAQQKNDEEIEDRELDTISGGCPPGEGAGAGQGSAEPDNPPGVISAG